MQRGACQLFSFEPSILMLLLRLLMQEDSPPPNIQKRTALGAPEPDCGFVHTLSDRQSSLRGRPVCASAVRIACPAGPLMYAWSVGTDPRQ